MESVNLRSANRIAGFYFVDEDRWQLLPRTEEELDWDDPDIANDYAHNYEGEWLDEVNAIRFSIHEVTTNFIICVIETPHKNWIRSFKNKLYNKFPEEMAYVKKFDYEWHDGERGVYGYSDEKVVNESVNDEEIPSKLYHATYSKLWKKIKKAGYLGNSPYKLWSDSNNKFVYLATEPEVAESYAEVALDDAPERLYNMLEDDSIVILEIDAEKLDKTKLSIDNNVQNNDGSSYQYEGTIPLIAINVTNIMSESVFYNGEVEPNDYNRQRYDIKVLKNPTYREIDSLLNKHPLRFLISNGELFVWDAMKVNHADICKDFGLTMDMGGRLVKGQKNFIIVSDMFFYYNDSKDYGTFNPVTKDETSLKKELEDGVYDNIFKMVFPTGYVIIDEGGNELFGKEHYGNGEETQDASWDGKELSNDVNNQIEESLKLAGITLEEDVSNIKIIAYHGSVEDNLEVDSNKAFYLTDNYDLAKKFAYREVFDDGLYEGEIPIIYTYELDFKNPYYMTQEEYDLEGQDSNIDFVKWLKSNYDGIIIKAKGYSTYYICFKKGTYKLINKEILPHDTLEESEKIQ